METVIALKFPYSAGFIPFSGEPGGGFICYILQRPPVSFTIDCDPRVYNGGIADILKTHRSIWLPTLIVGAVTDRHTRHNAINLTGHTQFILTRAGRYDHFIGLVMVAL